MDNIVTKIVELAEKLDSIGLEKSANTADNIALSLVKTAQFVGIQGYWIRNNRCWQNCYRQKKANYPDKSSQDVWFDCHEEYEDSINADDTSNWDKYAGSEFKNIKLSSNDKKLNLRLAEHINNFEDVEEGLISAYKKFASESKESYLSATNDMLNLADSLHNINKDLSLEAAALGSELFKEAGWWDGLGAVKDLGSQWVNRQNNPANTAPTQQTWRDFKNQRENTNNQIQEIKKQREQQIKDLNENKGFQTKQQRFERAIELGKRNDPTAFNAFIKNNPDIIEDLKNIKTDVVGPIIKKKVEDFEAVNGLISGAAPVTNNPATSTAPTSTNNVAAPASTVPTNNVTAPTAVNGGNANPSTVPATSNQSNNGQSSVASNELASDLGVLLTNARSSKDPNAAHAEIVNWMTNNGWNDKNAANNFANWFVGKQILSSKELKRTLFKL